jgi:hypothetical protein
MRAGASSNDELKKIDEQYAKAHSEAKRAQVEGKIAAERVLDQKTGDADRTCNEKLRSIGSPWCIEFASTPSQLPVDEAEALSELTKFRKDEQRNYRANVKKTNDVEAQRRQQLAEKKAANSNVDKRVWTYWAAHDAAHIDACRECDEEKHRVNEEFNDALVKATTLLYQV